MTFSYITQSYIHAMDEPMPSTKYRLGEMYCLAAGSSLLFTFGPYCSSLSSLQAIIRWAMLCRLADSVSTVCSDRHYLIVNKNSLQLCCSQSPAAQSDRGIKSLPSLICLGIHTSYIASAIPQLVLREATKHFILLYACASPMGLGEWNLHAYSTLEGSGLSI